MNPLRLSLLGVALFSAGCASGDKPKPPTYLGLATLSASEGFQVRSHGTTIPPGEDLEFCEIAELPGSPSDTYYVKEIELGNGEHSHHLIINMVNPGGAAEAKLADMPLGVPVPCLGAQPEYGDGFEFTMGIQKPYGQTTFPPGVGRIYHGGQRFVFDYHYYNSSTTAVEARSAVNFHLTDAANVKHIAKIFGFYNWTIDTPPHQTGSFTGECKFKQDIMVQGLTRHTHRWGTDFTAWYLGGANDGQEIFTSHSFEEDVDHAFPAPFVAKAGEGFRFRCNYNNTEDHDLRFGVNATDEMCILFGEGWEATDGEALDSQDCFMTHIEQDGIARSGAGNFRPPTPAEVTACLQQTPYTGTCAQCGCNTCGGVIADCYGNADCKAIVDCVRSSGCTGTTACGAACGSVINAHSTALGMVIQLQSCFSNCTGVCGGSSGDGGVQDAGPG